MKYILLLITVFSFVNLGLAQNNANAVEGIVINELTQEPLAGVKVEVMNIHPTQWVATTEDGKFTFENLPAGKHRLVVHAEGYSASVEPFEVTKDGSIPVLKVEISENVSFGQVGDDASKMTAKSKNQPKFP